MVKTTPTKVLIAVTFLLAASLASAQHCRKIDIDKSSGFCTVPDPKLTPGEMDASLACVSNTDRPRSVTNAEKNAILAAYGYPASTKKSSGEFDHWLPHWMGGSDMQENIWFEPHAGKYGSFVKDKVELLLWRKVCVNKTMSLDQAKAVYLRGWTKLVPFNKVVGLVYETRLNRPCAPQASPPVRGCPSENGHTSRTGYEGSGL